MAGEGACGKACKYKLSVVIFVAVAVFAAGQMVGARQQASFEDVPTGHWASEAIEWAVRHGITTGISPTEFGPEMTVTRAQLVTMLYRTAELARHQAKFKFVDIPATVPGHMQHSHDGWSCALYGTAPYFSLQCRGAEGKIPRGLQSASALSVGSRMGCVIRYAASHTDFNYQTVGVGPLDCWGMNVPDGMDLDTDSQFVDVAVGSVSYLGSETHQVCAIRYDPESVGTAVGSLECWGDIPVEASDQVDWVDVTVGEGHVCAIFEVEFDGAGYIECWGNNNSGQTDDPVGIFDEVRSRHDLNFTCALNSYSSEWECWGRGNPVPKP